MQAENIKERLRRVRQALRSSRYQALLVLNPANVRYLTGFGGEDSWSLVTSRQCYLMTDSRFGEQAAKECPAVKIIERKTTLIGQTAKVIGRLKNVETIAVENTLPLAVFGKLKKALDAKLKPVDSLVEKLRVTKDPCEVSCIRKAGKIAAGAFEQIQSAVKPGITESELAGLLELEIRRAGATTSFETIVAFGANASQPHYRPGTVKLKKNDTILIDFGVRYLGYCCDITRNLTVGKVSAFYKKAYRAVAEAQKAAIAQIRAGADIQTVDRAARDVIKQADLPVYGHGTGHGLGLDIHERPAVVGENKDQFEAGMAITIEPGVYIPGKLGIRIEDDILVTETGCKILTHCKKMII